MFPIFRARPMNAVVVYSLILHAAFLGIVNPKARDCNYRDWNFPGTRHITLGSGARWNLKIPVRVGVP